MTHQLLTIDYSRQQAVLRSKHLIHHVKLYSLYRLDKVSNRWIRISTMAYNEKLAYRVFGEQVASDILSLKIRPIKLECLGAK